MRCPECFVDLELESNTPVMAVWTCPECDYENVTPPVEMRNP